MMQNQRNGKHSPVVALLQLRALRRLLAVVLAVLLLHPKFLLARLAKDSSRDIGSCLLEVRLGTLTLIDP